MVMWNIPVAMFMSIILDPYGFYMSPILEYGYYMDSCGHVEGMRLCLNLGNSCSRTATGLNMIRRLFSLVVD